jgi:hypothetical protein
MREFSNQERYESFKELLLQNGIEIGTHANSRKVRIDADGVEKTPILEQDIRDCVRIMERLQQVDVEKKPEQFMKLLEVYAGYLENMANKIEVDDIRQAYKLYAGFEDWIYVHFSDTLGREILLIVNDKWLGEEVPPRPGTPETREAEARARAAAAEKPKVEVSAESSAPKVGVGPEKKKDGRASVVPPLPPLSGLARSSQSNEAGSLNLPRLLGSKETAPLAPPRSPRGNEVPPPVPPRSSQSNGAAPAAPPRSPRGNEVPPPVPPRVSRGNEVPPSGPLPSPDSIDQRTASSKVNRNISEGIIIEVRAAVEKAKKARLAKERSAPSRAAAMESAQKAQVVKDRKKSQAEKERARKVEARSKSGLERK